MSTQPQTRVSLCMIVRNEAENITRCLASVQDIVDEMIIVDTGSTDETVALCEEFGAHVVHYPWHDDFSAARNYGLEHAFGDWILVLDADDELREADRGKVRPLVQSGHVDAYFFITQNLVGDFADPETLSYEQLRLFRRRPDFRYEGAIHEAIPAIAGARCKQTPIVVIHRGYLSGHVQGQGKVNRNIGILCKELSKKRGDPWLLYYLGNEFLRVNRTRAARRCYKKAWVKLTSGDSPDTSWIPDLPLKYAFSLWRSDEADTAMEVLRAALPRTPDYTDLWFMLGSILFENNQLDRATEGLEKCLRMGEAPTKYPTQLGCGSFRAAFFLGLIAMEQRDIPLASTRFTDSLRMNPRHLPTITQYSLCGWAQREFSLITEFLDHLENPLSDIPWIRFLRDMNQSLATGFIVPTIYEGTNMTALMSCLASLAAFEQFDLVARILHQSPRSVLLVAYEERWYYEAIGICWLRARAHLEEWT